MSHLKELLSNVLGSRTLKEGVSILFTGKKPSPSVKGISIGSRRKLSQNYFYSIPTGNKFLELDAGFLYPEDSIVYLDRILAEDSLFSLHDTGITSISNQTFFDSSVFVQLVESVYWTFNEFFLQDLLIQLHSRAAKSGNCNGIFQYMLKLLNNNPQPYMVPKENQYEWARSKKLYCLIQEKAPSFHKAIDKDKSNRERIKRELTKIIGDSQKKVTKERCLSSFDNGTESFQDFVNRFVDESSAEKFINLIYKLMVSYKEGVDGLPLIEEMQRLKSKGKKMPGNSHLQLFLVVSKFQSAGRFKESVPLVFENSDLIDSLYIWLLLPRINKYQEYLKVVTQPKKRSILREKTLKIVTEMVEESLSD